MMSDSSRVSARGNFDRSGILEWFHLGEYERVQQVLADLQELNIRHLRTGFSWADWYTPQGERWYAWLLPELARHIQVLPCFTYTPPSIAVVPKTSAPPRDLKSFADFLDVVITRFGDHFEWIELWNEPNNINDWDWRLDPQWHAFTEMIGNAAYWCRACGKKTVLGGMCPTDPNWLNLMGERGILQLIDAVGLHGFPGTWEHDWTNWQEPVNKVADVLAKHELTCQIWITEAGYSTWQHDEFVQLREFVRAMEAPVQRVYWYCAHDLHPDKPHQDGFHKDERHYHFGFKKADGEAKLLYRILKDEGLDGARSLISMIDERHRAQGTPRSRTDSARDSRPVLITGGAGFIGTHLAQHFLSQGTPVILFDNLARPGADQNLRRLYRYHHDQLDVRVADIRDPYAVGEAVSEAGQIFHLAAQTRIGRSIESPVYDFHVNLQGTLNILEAMRSSYQPPPLVFVSSNKVYGSLAPILLEEHSRRYIPVDARIRIAGINETFPLDGRSPYACSRGAADQYVLSYAQTYDLPAVVLRLSSVYGPHQLGTEEQGWVAQLVQQAFEEGPITLFGNGKQVRDVLFVGDLVKALVLAGGHIDRLQGSAFNLGGGPEHAVSLREFLALLEHLLNKPVSYSLLPARDEDQKYYVSDFSRFHQMTAWFPAVGVKEGLQRLCQSIDHRHDPLIPLKTEARR